VEERERQIKMDKKEALLPREEDFDEGGKLKSRAERRNQRRREKVFLP
jgi:hypothetical protein